MKIKITPISKPVKNCKNKFKIVLRKNAKTAAIEPKEIPPIIYFKVSMYLLLVYQTINGKSMAEKIMSIKEKNNHSKTKFKSRTVSMKETMKSDEIDKESTQNSGCKMMKLASCFTFLTLVLGKIKFLRAI